jgi:hypothetical protein
VIGESFDMPVLSELTDIPESQLYDVFRPAEEAHVIIEAPGHEGDFAFVNSAERDALLGLIAPEERKELNKRLVDIEQRLHLSHSNLILGRLVNHLVQGSQWQEATRLHERMASSYIKEPVSHEALEQLQRMTMTRVSAKEMPLSEDDLKRAARTARALKIAIQNLRLYPPTNENVRKSVEFVFKELVYFFSETEAFTISATPEAILINGSQSQTTETENIVSKLYDILNGLGLHGIMGSPSMNSFHSSRWWRGLRVKTWQTGTTV